MQTWIGASELVQDGHGLAEQVFAAARVPTQPARLGAL